MLTTLYSCICSYKAAVQTQGYLDWVWASLIVWLCETRSGRKISTETRPILQRLGQSSAMLSISYTVVYLSHA